MKKIVLAVLNLLCIPLTATNIKVCNNTDGQIWVHVDASRFIGLKVCEDHEGPIEVHQCNDWDVHGCNAYVRIYFPDHTCLEFTTDSNTSDCSVTAIKEGSQYKLSDVSGTINDKAHYVSHGQLQGGC